MGDMGTSPQSPCQGPAVPWGGSGGLSQGVALGALFGWGGHWLKQLWGAMEDGTGVSGVAQVRCSGRCQPLCGFAEPLDDPFCARVAKNNPCSSIPCSPPHRTPDVWIGAPPPAFPQEETQGWREEEAAPREGRDRRDRGDTSVGLGSHQDWGPGALLEWGAPGPSSASSCGCGCRALPRSSTLRAGMSAGRCHGGPHLCPSISWGLSAAPEGVVHPFFRGQRSAARPGVGAEPGVMLGSVAGTRLGIRGTRPFLQGLFLIHPLSAGQRGNVGSLAKLIVGKRRCSKPQRALGAEVP